MREPAPVREPASLREPGPARELASPARRETADTAAIPGPVAPAAPGPGPGIAPAEGPASAPATAIAPGAAIALVPAHAGAGPRPNGPSTVAVADDREREHLRSPAPPAPRPHGGSAPGSVAHARPVDDDAMSADGSRPTCTVAQLRRFIKSRPWVPMHELRRRFGIAGVEDDVTPIRVGATRLYVGLPHAEGRLVAELLAGGDVGYELSLDPDVPVVVGVYPMRPVPRS
ncbi:MAG: hypothetical protein A2V85_17660 [Chloroflexi bacterium RBG_16_72_14]|nr:MAG: hypothetical protein A2V85_17660 [Chloroflexi bacterium RBG_16_72_14]